MPSGEWNPIAFATFCWLEATYAHQPHSAGRDSTRTWITGKPLRILPTTDSYRPINILGKAGGMKIINLIFQRFFITELAPLMELKHTERFSGSTSRPPSIPSSTWWRRERLHCTSPSAMYPIFRASRSELLPVNNNKFKLQVALWMMVSHTIFSRGSFRFRIKMQGSGL